MWCLISSRTIWRFLIVCARYNLSFECRNFTNEKLYDNFSLQKPGRAFYGKVRVYFGN